MKLVEPFENKKNIPFKEGFIKNTARFDPITS